MRKIHKNISNFSKYFTQGLFSVEKNLEIAVSRLHSNNVLENAKTNLKIVTFSQFYPFSRCSNYFGKYGHISKILSDVLIYISFVQRIGGHNIAFTVLNFYYLKW